MIWLWMPHSSHLLAVYRQAGPHGCHSALHAATALYTENFTTGDSPRCSKQCQPQYPHTGFSYAGGSLYYNYGLHCENTHARTTKGNVQKCTPSKVRARVAASSCKSIDLWGKNWCSSACTGSDLATRAVVLTATNCPKSVYRLYLLARTYKEALRSPQRDKPWCC